MKLNELKDNDGARRDKIRVGRGIGSGKGKTAGRGVKGQGSRTGVRINGFEGGQMPLHRRLPKRGFNNYSRTENETVNFSELQRAVDAKRLDASQPVTVEALKNAGLIRGNGARVKLLSKGTLTSKLSFEIDSASEAAKAAIEKLGGSVKFLAAKSSSVTEKKEKDRAGKLEKRTKAGKTKVTVGKVAKARAATKKA